MFNRTNIFSFLFGNLADATQKSPTISSNKATEESSHLEADLSTSLISHNKSKSDVDYESVTLHLLHLKKELQLFYDSLIKRKSSENSNTFSISEYKEQRQFILNLNKQLPRSRLIYSAHEKSALALLEELLTFTNKIDHFINQTALTIEKEFKSNLTVIQKMGTPSTLIEIPESTDQLSVQQNNLAYLSSFIHADLQSTFIVKQATISLNILLHEFNDAVSSLQTYLKNQINIYKAQVDELSEKKTIKNTFFSGLEDELQHKNYLIDQLFVFRKLIDFLSPDDQDSFQRILDQCENTLSEQFDIQPMKWDQKIENKAKELIQSQNEWEHLLTLLSQAFSDHEIKPSIIAHANRVYQNLREKSSILSTYLKPPHGSLIQKQAYHLLLLNCTRLENIEKILKNSKVHTLSIIDSDLINFKEKLIITEARINAYDQKAQHEIASKMESALFEINNKIGSIPYVNLTKKQQSSLTSLSILLVSVFKKPDAMLVNHFKLRLQQLGIFNKQSDLSLIHHKETVLNHLEKMKSELSQLVTKSNQSITVYRDILDLTNWAINGLQSTLFSSYHSRL